MRILGVVSYNGTNYSGWQIQPDKVSVEETIEKELSKIFNRPINIYGAGRTDAGVHALGQTFHFDLDEQEVDLSKILYSLNSLLPPDIKIEDLEEVDDDFHARFSAKEKIYGYTIIQDSKDVFFYNIAYLCPFDLDLEVFEEALKHFVGKHNFKNFTSKEEDQDGFVREIYEIKFDSNNDNINITLRGNGFMKYMIRYIVGTSIEVARGKISFELIDELLDEESPRQIVSWKAPACGLILLEVKY